MAPCLRASRRPLTGLLLALLLGVATCAGQVSIEQGPGGRPGRCGGRCGNKEAYLGNNRHN